MRLSSFLKASQIKHGQVLQFVRGCWNKIMADSACVEYKQWRYHFIVQRLYLMTWVSIVVMASGQLVNWIVPLTSWDLSGARYNFYQQHIELFDRIVLFGWFEILFTFVLLKISYIRKRPVVILMWLTWVWLMSHQVIISIFFNQIILDGSGWILLFSAGPILMPVKWRSHCFCQLVFFAYLAVTHLVFGIKDSFANEIEYFDAIYITSIACIIVDYAVYLYEKFLQQEFELKRQLRLFLHTVSHDLRSPVLGTMFLLKSLRNPNAKETTIANEIIDRTIESSHRQLQLIDSLLEAHATETKGIAIRPRPVCLDTLTKSVVTEIEPILNSKNATITRKIPKKLSLVNIDPLQIRRVYDNLIANAIEYNQPGLHLTLKVKDEYDSLHGSRSNWIYCTVSDNGIGISSQQSTHIFDLYTRATSNKQSLNIGLGLYICRQIINAHGGEIGVDSSNRGATFWFTLPIV